MEGVLWMNLKIVLFIGAEQGPVWRGLSDKVSKIPSSGVALFGNFYSWCNFYVHKYFVLHGSAYQGGY
jgi:hypothetical protein